MLRGLFHITGGITIFTFFKNASLLLLFNSYHFESGIQADCDLICFAGISLRKVQNFDIQVLGVLCVIAGHSVFTGCKYLVDCIGEQMDLYVRKKLIVFVPDKKSVGSNLFSLVIAAH